MRIVFKDNLLTNQVIDVIRCHEIRKGDGRIEEVIRQVLISLRFGKGTCCNIT